MLIYFAALVTAALILLIHNPRSETNRTAALFLGCASIGGLSEMFASVGLLGVSQACTFLNLNLTPYAVLVFCIVYSESVKSLRLRRLVKWLLLIPAAVMLAVTPFSPVMKIDYRLLLVWSAPYYLISCYLLIVACWMEKDRRKRRSRAVTTAIIVPTILAVLVLINVAQAIRPGFDFFRYISLFIGYSFMAALLFTFLYGVLGVKLRFERDPLEETMKAVSSGTAILNHSVKNEVGKIAISAENLKRTLPDSDERIRQHLDIIGHAAEHMMSMVDRIHSQMREMAVNERPVSLERLADACLARHVRLFEAQGVETALLADGRPVVLCDDVHIEEALGNLLTNAAEAMPHGGTVRILIGESKKGAFLAVTDTGAGIPADKLNQVFEPFFSTKHRSRNFGLGLSYVYNVMRAHGGTVEITSRVHTGTAVTLQFPRSKTVKWRDGV